MSDNLGLTQLVQSQANKEVTINDQAGELDAAFTAGLAIAITSTNARTLTDTELRRHFFFDLDPDGGDPPGAAITLTVPAGISRGLFAVVNDTGFDVTVEIAGQALISPVVADGQAALLTSDGVNVRLAGGGGGAGGGSTFYDIGFLYSGGPPGASELLFKWIATRDLTLAVDFAGAVGHIGTNPTSTFDMDVTLDGASIGTISVSTGGVLTFTTTSGTAKSVTAGQRLEVVAPGSADATAADIAVTFTATID
jgi:hypothetical protein